MTPPLSPGQLAQVARILEATARKPGNVHRFADFEDCTYVDSLLGATALAGPLDRARTIGVGGTVLEAVEATRRVSATNTNLGTILLLAPLAAVPDGDDLRAGVARVLAGLTVEDARRAYQAIRLARPADLGSVPDHDVVTEPTCSLLDAMRLAADRDLVARQYANGYAEVFDAGVPLLRQGLEAGLSLEAAILTAFVVLLGRYPDTLIARRLGPEAASEVMRRAAETFASGRLAEFDAYLRAGGHARNPGAMADLIAATLYVALHDGIIPLPRPAGSAGWLI